MVVRVIGCLQALPSNLIFRGPPFYAILRQTASFFRRVAAKRGIAVGESVAVGRVWKHVPYVCQPNQSRRANPHAPRIGALQTTIVNSADQTSKNSAGITVDGPL